jgi:hypothetical protein
MTSIHTRNMHIFLIVTELQIIHKSTFNFLAIIIHSIIFYDGIEDYKGLDFPSFFDEYGGESMKCN